MGAAIPIVSAVGGLFGAANSANQQSQANNAAQQSAQAQQQIQQQQLQLEQGLANDYTNYYQPELPGAQSAIGNLLSGPGQLAGDVAGAATKAGFDPSILANLTGINSNQLNQNATNYLSHPEGSNVGQMGGSILNGLGAQSQLGAQAPGLQQFYQKEQTQGINPQFASNAQNQLQQQFARSLSDLQGKAGPGQNQNAAIIDLQDNLLSNSTNLAGNLAGQSQQIAQQGAQGQQNLAGAVDSQKMQQLLSQLQAAGAIDQQTANSLLQSAQLGQNANQTQFSNLNTASQTSTGAVNDALQYINQGRSYIPGVASGLGQLGAQYGQQAANEGAAAASYGNPWASGVQSAVNAFGNKSSGGSTPPGQAYAPPPSDYSGGGFTGQEETGQIPGGLGFI